VEARDFDWPEREDLIAAVVPLFGDAVCEQILGILPVRLRTGVCLRRISPVTSEPYPHSADTRALRPVWDERLTNWLRPARGELIETEEV
jgi:ABC-type siderophore export system fused ATPase/permease subunit